MWRRTEIPTGLKKAGLAALVGIVVLTGIMGSTARAVAEGVAVALTRDLTTTLTTDRDPQDFLGTISPVLPRPTVPLTIEDAVSYEIRRRSRTLSAEEVALTAQAICEEAHAAGYNPLLFVAVIHIESYYNHMAVSPVGAEGLMQLMPYTAEWMAERDGLDWPDGHSFDPVLNVRLGVRYLIHLHKQLRRMDYALTAYNRGPSATRYIVRKYGGLPDFVHEFYSEKVLTRYRLLQHTYSDLPFSEISAS